MGLFDDLIPQAAGAKTIPNEGRALLSAIAGGESQGYNQMYGGGLFSDFADHPRQAIPIQSGPNAGKTSSAAGLYQFLGPTWDEVKKEANLPDFSPASQDQGAWHLANKVYKQKTGRDLLGDLQLAGGDPAKVNMIGRYLASTWTSIPGGIEPNSQTGGFGQRYARGLGPQPQASEFSGQSRQPVAGMFDDLIPPARFADTAGENFRTTREGVSEPAPPPLTFGQKLQKVWDEPEPGGLVSIVKPILKGAEKVGLAAAGDIPVRDESGQISPEIIGAAADVARGVPMASAPGGVFAAQITPKVVEKITQAAVAPATSQALKQAATEGFQSAPVKDLGVAPKAIGELAATRKAALNETGIDEILAPKTFAILGKMEKAPEGAVVTGQNLQTLRRTFGEVAGSADKTERKAAKTVIDAIDDFLPNVAARDILSGDAKAAAQAWQTARGNYAAAMRSEDIARAVLKAERQAGSAGSGGNIDNATRQQFKAILNNDKKMRGFNADERAQMEAIVAGTTGGNLARLAGKLSPTGVVSAALGGGAGYAFAGPAGAIMLPIAGLIGKKFGDRSTASQVRRLDELVRSRAPLQKTMEDLARRVETIKLEGPNARTLSALSLAARNLSNNLRDAGINLAPADIMRSLVGPMRGAAEEDQTQ
jgi:muramidase (phage lysozyme)